MCAKTCFVSDLHLFCRRFAGDRHWDELREVSKEATTVILGGDIFDFRWTALPTVEHSADRAIQMLESLVRENRECEFHYLLGNHDHHESFVGRLKRLAGDVSNLLQHPYYLRLGKGVFLHGDVATRRMGPEQLEKARRRWLHDRRRGRLANRAYDASVHVGLHRLAYRLAYPKNAVARRVLAYLGEVGHGPAAGVTDVYFGHTHIAMSAFAWNGVRFHNCGAPIRGADFRILEDVVTDA
jgi:UDP-2,3-diacylglucosamine hydrolase